MAAFWELSTLRFIIINSRWTGPPSQEATRKEYLQMRMREAVKYLSVIPEN